MVSRGTPGITVLPWVGVSHKLVNPWVGVSHKLVNPWVGVSHNQVVTWLVLDLWGYRFVHSVDCGAYLQIVVTYAGHNRHDKSIFSPASSSGE